MDENFLGTSRNFTEDLTFYNCDQPGFPRIKAEGLTYLLVQEYGQQSSQPITSLKKNTFAGTPELEDLVISLDGGSLTLPRGVFRSLTKLKTVVIWCSVQLRFGAGHFFSPALKFLGFGYSSSDRVDFDPGSLSGIPAGAKLELGGAVIGGWQPSKFFNILRGGVILDVLDTQDCDCDLAWIRHSVFLKQVVMNCETGEGDVMPLSQHDFSHCPFHQHQSLHRTEL